MQRQQEVGEADSRVVLRTQLPSNGGTPGSSDSNVLGRGRPLHALGDLSVTAISRQSSSIRRTATAASCSLSALPDSFGAAAVTDEQLVYGRSTVLTRVLASAASRRFPDAFTTER